MTEPKCDRWPEEFTEEYMKEKGQQNEETFMREYENLPIVKCDRCGDTGKYDATPHFPIRPTNRRMKLPCNALPTCTAAREGTDKEADDGEGKG